MQKKRSLRGLLLIGFFLFTLLPLALLAVVVQNQYQKSINQQIKDRLTVQVRELEGFIAKSRGDLEVFLEKSLLDKSLVYYLSTLEPSGLKAALIDRIELFKQNEVQVYSPTGEVLLNYRGEFIDAKEQSPLSLALRKNLDNKLTFYRASFRRNANQETVLVLSIIRKMLGLQDRIIGYIESVFVLDKAYLEKATKTMAAEVVFFDQEGNILLGTLPKSMNKLNLGKKFLKGRDTFFEFSVDETPYAFMSTDINWGQSEFLIGIGSSKSSAVAGMANVQTVITFAFLCLFIFILVLSFLFVREVIAPIEQLIQASKKLQKGEPFEPVQSNSHTEIADLIGSFNDMADQVVKSDKELKSQLKLLEQAKEKIRSTQYQLVQSAKLASLGELVAGIAHELNNPIGFIYSNIEYLKKYSNSLFKIVDKSLTNSSELELLVIEEDYRYIKKDLPKLIQSCEEGSVRAKDIVVGLRNFSRSDDELIQELDINKAIESTIKLLSGVISNKVTIKTELSSVPKIQANSNQIKQVFMNLMSNGIQAIDDRGDLIVRSHFDEDRNLLLVEFQDSGVGISDDAIDKIFDPFYTTKDVGQGTGLGLSISYGIIKSRGGTIRVESQQGVGSTFVVEIPLIPTV